MNQNIKKFPTSEEFYKRIINDRNIASTNVAIIYYDSILDKHLEKNINMWSTTSNGGDIPWHRVYAFKYKDEIIWDRLNKKYSIEGIIECQKKIKSNFKIVSYNILNNETLIDRAADIINYLHSTDADIICLQEVPIVDNPTETISNQNLTGGHRSTAMIN